MSEQEKCPICERKMDQKSEPLQDNLGVRQYSCSTCGTYCVTRSDEEDYLDRSAKSAITHPTRVAALLAERRLQGRRAPFLVFKSNKYSDIKRFPFLRIDDLLAEWPEFVPERIDRCLCNLAAYAPSAGQRITSQGFRSSDFLFFTDNPEEEQYYVDALIKRTWIETILGTFSRNMLNDYEFVITPEGWARVHDLAGGAERKWNPAFVAMWFGKKGDIDRTDEMTSLFDEVVKPACNGAGYRAKRANTEDHNDFIMSRVLEDIRTAPFVIAELTENSSGVYYEAGFARGQGVDVIFCTPSVSDVHFDVSGVNLLLWGDDRRCFRERLESWILGTIGRGPHKPAETA